MRSTLLLAGLLAGSCGAPEPAPDPALSGVTEEPANDALVLGAGDRAVLVLATIHGDEAAGTPLVRELARRLAAGEASVSGGRVVILPVANPEGMAAGTRTNANGVDLNRNFPAANWSRRQSSGSEPLSEPESRRIFALLERHRPAVVVTLHQAAACVDYDGPAAELARAMSQACGLPVRRLGSRPGSLGSLVGVDRGLPIVTLELPRGADRMDAGELWRRYGEALLVALNWPAPQVSASRAPR